MKRIAWLSLLLPCATMAQPVVEDDISYLYLSLGYIDATADAAGGDIDGSGLGLEYSFEVRDHIHLFGAYEAAELDDMDADGTLRVFGAGTHFNVTDRISLFGRLGYADVDATVGFGGASDDGYSLEAGVRYRPARGFEIRGGVDHFELEDAGSDTGFTFGGDLFLTDVVALSIDVNERDNGRTLLLGGRFYFGNVTVRGDRP